LIGPEKHKSQKKKIATQLRVLVSLLMDNRLNLNDGTCCYPIFDPYFDKFSEKIKKRQKNNENPKKCIVDIFASF
jgi:hypothetical protein